MWRRSDRKIQFNILTQCVCDRYWGSTKLSWRQSVPSIKWYHIVTSLLEAPKGKIKEIEAVAQIVPQLRQWNWILPCCLSKPDCEGNIWVPNQAFHVSGQNHKALLLLPYEKGRLPYFQNVNYFVSHLTQTSKCLWHAFFPWLLYCHTAASLLWVGSGTIVPIFFCHSYGILFHLTLCLIQ